MSDAYTGAAFITCRLTINAKHLSRPRWAHSKQSIPTRWPDLGFRADSRPDL